ncbi:MAG: CopG family antitoxin [Candidatus Dormibacteria bacterium]
MTRASFLDPYEGMSDDELDRHFSELITGNRQRQRAVSIRFPEELLEELRYLATQLGVPYQTLIKLLLEQDVARLRAHPLRASHGAARATAKRTAKVKAAPATKRSPSASSKRAAKKRGTARPRVPV